MDNMEQTFITYVSQTLAKTSTGLSGAEIVKEISRFAIEFNREVPYNKSPLPFNASKATALAENLMVFDGKEQFIIIKHLCEIDKFANNTEVQEVKRKLLKKYPEYATDELCETELVTQTKHWLGEHEAALKLYEQALEKYNGGIYERNTLDDMRLSFELLIKDLLHNGRSLDNQINDIGAALKHVGCPPELRNMVASTIKYYTKYQNDHVKHDDKVNSNDIEYIIELTSVVMKYLIKMLEGKADGTT